MWVVRERWEGEREEKSEYRVPVKKLKLVLATIQL